jgi:NADPH:quinone reductase-like Zn-dependent oxidoreductase
VQCVASSCDAVFDTVGGDVATRSFAVLKPGGRAALLRPARGAPWTEMAAAV